MRMLINNKIFEFEGNTKNVENIFDTIRNELAECDLELSYLIIDRIEIRDNYQSYISENINSIQEIVAIINDMKSLVGETFKSTFDYISNAIDMLKSISDEFYKSPKKETWNELANLLEGIQWILATLARIDEIKNLKDIIVNYDLWNEYVQTVKSLSAEIVQLEEAMINNDNVLTGDLLLYEILPIFEKAKEKLRFLIPVERKVNVS